MIIPFGFFNGLSKTLAELFAEYISGESGTSEETEACFSPLESIIADVSQLLQPAGWKATKLYNVEPMDADGEWTVARTSVANRVNADSKIEEMAANVPLIDYAEGNTCGELLIEEASTNEFNYSEQIDQYSLTNVTVSANNIQSPRSTTDITADKILETIVTANHRIGKWVSVVSGDRVRISFFAKQGERQYCYYRAKPDNVTWVNVGFDLNDGTVSYEGSGLSAKVEALADGWYRCYVSFTVSATFSLGSRIGISNADVTTDTEPSYLGDSTKGLYFWGMHMEIDDDYAPFDWCSSYIETPSSSSATRTKCTILDCGSVGSLPDTTGTVYIERKLLSTLDYGGASSWISISDGTIDNYLQISQGSLSGWLSVASRVGGVGKTSITAIGVPTTTWTKIGYTWKTGSQQVAVNGVSKGTDSETVWSNGTLSEMHLSNYNGLGSNTSFNGRIRSLRVYDAWMDSTTLLDLTT